MLSSLGCLQKSNPNYCKFLNINQCWTQLNPTSDSQKMTKLLTKRRNWSIGWVGSCSFFPVDCDANYWLRQGQNMIKKKWNLPITEIKLAIMYIDRVLSSLGCLTEKQPNSKVFLEYQSMLNSTRPHKRFSKNDKNINETENWSIGWVGSCSFFPVDCDAICWLRQGRKMSTKKMKFANHRNHVGNHVYRSCA